MFPQWMDFVIGFLKNPLPISTTSGGAGGGSSTDSRASMRDKAHSHSKRI